MSVDKWIDKAKEIVNPSNENKELNKKEEKTYSTIYFSPKTDIFGCKDTDDLHLELDLPGISKEQLKINYANEILEIDANIELKEYEGLSPIYTEYKIGNYTRKFNIGEGYDIEKIKANFSDGVLKIHLPKREALKPKKIEIS